VQIRPLMLMIVATVTEPNSVVTLYKYNSVNDITGEAVTPDHAYDLNSNRVSDTSISPEGRPANANNGGQK
jgi:hypothetical protein